MDGKDNGQQSEKSRCKYLCELLPLASDCLQDGTYSARQAEHDDRGNEKKHPYDVPEDRNQLDVPGHARPRCDCRARTDYARTAS